MRTLHHCLLPSLALLLAACATPDDASRTDGAPGSLSSPLSPQMTTAITTPLSDLNLVNADIPAVLRAAQKAPYGVPEPLTCEGLTIEVQALDGALGADLDTPASNVNPSLIERGSAAANNAAVGAVRGAAEGVIPFRGWVRKLSGAERYTKQVAAAIAAGTVRRAYLKGLGQANRCTAPASPRLPVAKEAS